MKWLILSILGIILIALFGFLFYKNTNNSKIDENLLSIEDKKSNIFNVTVLEKSVFHLNKESEYEITSDKKDILVGDVVTTSKTGRAIIEDLYGSITVLDYSSKFKALQVDENTSKVFLESGKSWSRVKKVFKEGQSYEVETNNAVAIVRGTSFGIYILKGTTYLFVSEGTVLFVPVDVNTRERFYNRAVLVKASNKAYIDKNGNVILGPLTDSDIKDSWYIYNNNDFPTIYSDLENRSQNTNTNTATITTTINTTTPPSRTVTNSSNVGLGGSGGVVTTSISITSVNPADVYSGDMVYLKGSGFSKITSLTFGGYTVDISSLTIRDDNNLSFIIPDISPGVYSISITNNNKETATKDRAVTVKDFVDTSTYQYGQ